MLTSGGLKDSCSDWRGGSDIDRRLIEGKYFERDSYRELAECLVISAKAAESRLSRLCMKLRREMEAIEDNDQP